MRYIKLYEKFFGQYKKRVNILDVYTKEDIYDMLQELIDDYDLGLNIDHIYECRFSTKQFSGCEAVLDLDTNKSYYVSQHNLLHNSYCVYIPTLINDVELRNFLNSKAMLYDLNYILARYKSWIKIFIYKEI